MNKIANKIFWKLITLVTFILLLFVIFMFATDKWTIEQILDFMLISLYYLVPSILIYYILYKLFLERLILFFQRKKSAVILAEEINQVNQVSGPVRVGKDASTIGAAVIVGEHIIKKEKKELKTIREQLYIYDFNLINTWLDKNGSKFFVSSEERINNVFTSMLKENNSFIDPYWVAKGIEPSKHFYRWSLNKDKLVPDVAFNDGLYPGGIPFLDMLRKYCMIYMYHHYVPNFIMSNQPILEKFQIIDRKKIHRLFSKKLSQDFFKLKEDTPMPFPLRGFFIETETAIFYSNTDREGEKETKELNGIREFYTTVGHILREKVFLYGITQSPTRTIKALRELYPGYQHVFKRKFRGTSDYRRGFISFRIFLKKLKVIRLKLFRWIKLKIKFYSSIEKSLYRKIYKTKRKISYLHQKKTRLFNKGYIVFYKGIYENIKDVGKKVSFPTFGVMHENKSQNTLYNSFGFKQVNKIADCFGRYDTHVMKFIREQKEIIHNYDFTKVPNWEDFSIKLSDSVYLGYSQFQEILKVSIAKITREKEALQKIENKRMQRHKQGVSPELNILEISELLELVKDFNAVDGFKEVIVAFKTNMILAYQEVVDLDDEDQIQSIDFEDLRSLTIEDLKRLFKENQLFIQLETLEETYKEDIIGLLVNEYKSFYSGKEKKK